MKPGVLKTTLWYKCLVCHSCFQFPKALVVHRMKSQCRFKYKEIHKERSKWPFETPLLENLEEDEASHKDQQHFLKSQKPVEKAQETTILKPTEHYSNEFKPSVPELHERSKNLDLNQVTSYNVDPLPRNQEQFKYNCYFCTSLFTNFEDLNNHMISHTREKSDEYKSGPLNFDNCNKDGMRSDELKTYESTTLGKFICNLCQKSYCSKQYLNLHISVVHEKITPYSCKQCSKTFGQYINLKTHISTVHEKLKPYCCKQCPKCFGRSFHLRTHISAVHEQLRLYSCKSCAKTFSRSHHLKRHISTVHEQLKPYSCKQCLKTFGQSINLKTHISTVHEKLRLYSCKHCLKLFSQSGNLRAHVFSVHKFVNKV